ncbi:MAG: Na(+)/H(+) antiporter subunit D, partial [Thermoanaerobaculia bacterium]
RVDGLSLVFGYVFHAAAILGAIYALHVEDDVQLLAGLIYPGATLGALFAGDLLTLFCYWELMAVSSVFLIWARRNARAYRAGMRYLIVQITSGVILLAGILLHYRETGSLGFDAIGAETIGGAVILVAFGIKAAFPLLHNWLQDTYPEATVTGTLYLSIFTTKLAVYALARGFAGTELLIVIGVTMTAFPIFFAVIENDLRRVLTYSLNNQVGFMVAAIGIGTPMAINGATGYAFCNILFEGLLFMAMGAVLYRTGTIKCSELGGLFRSMPWTTGFCIVGAASISGFPFLNGFISKSLILEATADGHYTIAFFVLLFASAGVFHHSGIKVPYFAFFAHDSGIRCQEAPLHMRVAMGISAALCILIGLPFGAQWFYGLLPYPVTYDAYTVSHVVAYYQLLLFSALAFVALQLCGLYPAELRSTNLDSDWTYRRLLPNLVGALTRAGRRVWTPVRASGGRLADGALAAVQRWVGPRGLFARTWSTNDVATVVVLMLTGYLMLLFWFGIGSS